MAGFKESTESLHNVIAVAQSVLESTSDDDFVEILEKYSTQFAEWQKQAAESQPEDRDALEKLQTLHAQILDRAQKLHGGAAEEMRQLKKRGKGILAYTDILPKRFGAIRPRKG